MFRLLMVLLLLCSLPRAIADEPHHNLRAYQNPKFDAALRASEVVRLRFALAAAAARCRHVENLYGYRLLLAQFTADQQTLIATAVHEGTDRGARAAVEPTDTAGCAAALRDLRSADNELVVLSEQVANQDAPRYR